MPLLIQRFLNEFNAHQQQVGQRRRSRRRCRSSSSTPGRATSASCATSIERATILAESDFIGTRHLPPLLVTRGEETLPTITLTPGTTVDEAERRLILLTLDHTRNNKTRAAEILGIS